MNKNYFLLLISSVLFIFSCASFADTQQAVTEEKKARPDDDKVNPLENVDINIIKRDDKIIETHSVNGIIYKIKIIPSSGPAYYLYNTDGTGSLETGTNRALRDTNVQQWKIKEW